MKLVTAAQLFRAFSDQTRLRILNLLREHQLTGTEIARALRVPRGRVARHLRYLYKSWLVTTISRHGKTCYSIRPSDYELHETMMRRIVPLLAVLDGTEDDVARLGRL